MTAEDDKATLRFVRNELLEITGFTDNAGKRTWTELLAGVKNKLDEKDWDYQQMRDLYGGTIDTLDELGVAPQEGDPASRIRLLNSEMLREKERADAAERDRDRWKHRWTTTVNECIKILPSWGFSGGGELPQLIHEALSELTGGRDRDRGPVVHELDCDPYTFVPAVSCVESVHVFPHDADFRVGDTLALREWNETKGPEGGYTRGKCWRKILSITKDFPGLKEGYVMMRVSAVGAVVPEKDQIKG